MYQNLPIALASGAGAEWKNGLALVIIGGLLSSLFLTLIIVPVMYAIFDKLILRFSKNKEVAGVEELITAYYEEHSFPDYGHTVANV